MKKNIAEHLAQVARKAGFESGTVAPGPGTGPKGNLWGVYVRMFDCTWHHVSEALVRRHIVVHALNQPVDFS